MSRPPTLYLVAGEPSGDRLGAGLMRALRQVVPGVRCLGVGGRRMTEEGFKSLFDMSELSVMGFAEVAPRLPRLLRRLRETVADVAAARPDALVTIDSPGFTLRVARGVRARAPAIPTIHYVAPSVWAWRPGRARRMARHVDHVLALLPFEPPLMTATGMTCDFVGHPAVEVPAPDPARAAAFRARAGVGAGGCLVLVAPGSRGQEVRRMMPVFAEALARIAAERPGLRVAIPLADGVEELVTAAAAALDPAPVMIAPDDDAGRDAAFAAADVGLVKSGTIGLELAAAGTPMVAAYRTSALTAAILRPLLRVETASLVNLVAGETVVPEFLQERCTGAEIAPALLRLIRNETARAQQCRSFGRVLAALGGGGVPPTLRAAQAVLNVVERPRSRATAGQRA